MAYTVEKDIPIPMRKRGRKSKYPFAELEIGDSFFVPTNIDVMSPRASNVAKRTGRKFICRTVEGGVRVWRTA